MYESRPSLSTPHQYLPESDSWSWLKVTVKVPSPESSRFIFPDSAPWPDFTVTSLSSLTLHGSLQRYLWFFQANMCWHWNETSPHSNPSTSMLAATVHNQIMWEKVQESQSWSNTFMHVFFWRTYHIEDNRRHIWSPFFFPSPFCKLIKYLCLF